MSRDLELLTEAIADATEFLFEACPGDATRITRGLDGKNGAIFVLKNAEDVEAFTRLYQEKFLEEPAVACDAPHNVPPDYESN